MKQYNFQYVSVQQQQDDRIKQKIKAMSLLVGESSRVARLFHFPTKSAFYECISAKGPQA
jgi:hypothetical protein